MCACEVGGGGGGTESGGSRRSRRVVTCRAVCAGVESGVVHAQSREMQGTAAELCYCVLLVHTWQLACCCWRRYTIVSAQPWPPPPSSPAKRLSISTFAFFLGKRWKRGSVCIFANRGSDCCWLLLPPARPAAVAVVFCCCCFVMLFVPGLVLILMRTLSFELNYWAF